MLFLQTNGTIAVGDIEGELDVDGEGFDLSLFQSEYFNDTGTCRDRVIDNATILMYKISVWLRYL